MIFSQNVPLLIIIVVFSLLLLLVDEELPLPSFTTEHERGYPVALHVQLDQKTGIRVWLHTKVAFEDVAFVILLEEVNDSKSAKTMTHSPDDAGSATRQEARLLSIFVPFFCVFSFGGPFVSFHGGSDHCSPGK